MIRSSDSNLRRLYAGHQLVAAVASHLFLVDELDHRARRQFVERMMVAEDVLKCINDWLGQIVELGGSAEAAIDLKRQAHPSNVVLDKVARNADDACAQSVLADRDVRVKVVAQVAQVAGFGIFVEDQRMALFHRPGIGNLLEMASPVLRFRGVEPGVLEVAQYRCRAVKG